MAVTGVAIFVCSTANADDDAYYTEYLPGMPPNCEEPLLNRFFPGSTLEGCEAMYKADKFIEWACEEESLTKQRIAPHLLTQADVKWLTNVVNRKRACIDLLASKKKLRLWDTISRWWKGDKD
jgi:hypothetical protein